MREGASVLHEAGQLALGCELLGGTDWGNVDLDEARAAVRCALNNGIRVFDTADVYGLGRSERELGACLGRERNDVVIVTKGGVRWGKERSVGRAETWKDASPEYIKACIDSSLGRLGVQAISVFLLHWPDGKTPLDDTLEALEKARCQGKILSYGLSNHSPAAIQVAASALSCVQCQLSYLDRGGLEVCQVARSNGIAAMAYGVLSQGLLTGKYSERPRFPQSDRRHRLRLWSEGEWERSAKAVEALRSLACRRRATVSQVAIRWVLDVGGADIAVVGARNPAQVEANVGALDLSLKDDFDLS